MIAAVALTPLPNHASTRMRIITAMKAPAHRRGGIGISTAVTRAQRIQCAHRPKVPMQLLYLAEEAPMMEESQLIFLLPSLQLNASQI